MANFDAGDPQNEILNPLQVCAIVRRDGTGKFVYIKHAFQRCSKFFLPYAFKLVTYKHANQSYMTVSANGVTHSTADEMVFIPLSLWCSEYQRYLKLMKLKLFRLYQIYKPFYVWRKNIKTKKISKAVKYLDENLFLCDNHLRGALLKIMEIQWPFAEYNFINISHNTGDAATCVFQFVEMQLTKIEHVKEKFKLLRELAVDNVVHACINSISQGGYTTNNAQLVNEPNKKFNNPRRATLQPSFIEEAKRRNKMHQLSRFIRVADYTTVFLLLKLLENTYVAFLQFLIEHSKLLPDIEELKNEQQLSVIGQHSTLLDSSIQFSYIAIDVIFSDNGQVTVDPGIEMLNSIIHQIQSIWEEGARDILESHTTITRIQSWMRSVIDCGQLKTGSTSDASILANVIKSSLSIWNYKSALAELFNSNIKAVQLYCKSFNAIETYYKMTKACPSDMIQNNESSEMFRNWCFQYKEKEEEINEIVDCQLLGIFSLQLTRFKCEALTLTKNYQRILGQIIIQNRIGKSKVDILLSQILDATTYLASDPTTADCFAKYVDFIDNVQQRIDEIEVDADFIKELYDITEEYGIEVDAGDFTNYLVINVALTSFKIAVAQRLKERDKIISKFNEQISNDIRKLTDQVSIINESISERWLLDETSDADTCLTTLQDFHTKLEEYTKIVDTYHNYQKSFDLEIIRFDILDHVRNEIHLRTLLWKCIIFWRENSQKWYESNLNDLNAQEIASTTEQYVHYVDELEKGLGRESIVSHLKENVTYIRDRLPIINRLCNKHLRRRHWLEMEAILNYKFKPDTKVTLTLIENLGAFAHSQELINISERATSEANREAILNRIDDA